MMSCLKIKITMFVFQLV